MNLLTREELVTSLLADKRFKGMAEQLSSGWGTPLKPLAWQGVLCHGPNQGGKTTFTSPAGFFPTWRGIPEPDEAAPVAIAAYLGAYGPATPETFDAWLSRNSLSARSGGGAPRPSRRIRQVDGAGGVTAPRT
ncbi:DNA glycosylase AlkZ-like family protein [Saccharopolyspora sp. 5N708]|uniref:DNA glycosylase AlkZ-like family protein n=1 Tax=Saccharopolyspora sp. 5N708 TaxID=3457424 RepID=UPI003FD3BA89